MSRQATRQAKSDKGSKMSKGSKQLFGPPSEPVVGLIVEIDVGETRMDEFLVLMETNAIESRKEPGCWQFGMLVQAIFLQ